MGEIQMSDNKANHVPGGFSISRRQLAGAVASVGLVTAGAIPVAAKTPRRPRLNPQDRLEIEDLFAAYVWAYDCGDVDAFLSLFTDDALVVGRGTLYRDRQAIAGWFRYLIDMRDKEGDDIWMHEAGQFRFDGAVAPIVYAYATHFNGNIAKGTRGVRSLGYFVCECVKAKGEWKFRRFSITTWDKSVVPWKKPLPWVNA
jgi:uncharacterized protein (TIGR02246 family)